MSPYLAAKMGIRYSFLFGLFLCNISVLSAYYIVYVDKVLYPQQKHKYEILQQFSEPLLLSDNDSDNSDDNEHEHKNGHGQKIENNVTIKNNIISPKNKIRFLNDRNVNEIKIKITEEEEEDEKDEKDEENKELTKQEKDNVNSLIMLLTNEKEIFIESKVIDKNDENRDFEINELSEKINKDIVQINKIEENEDGSYNENDTDFVLNEILKKISVNDDDNDDEKIQKEEIKDFITTLSPIHQKYEINDKKKETDQENEIENVNEIEINTKLDAIDSNDRNSQNKSPKKGIELLSVFKFSRLFWTLTMSSLVVYGKY